MLILLKEFVGNFILKKSNGIVIESENLFDNKKLEYAFTTEEFMASISVLSDLTYDFFVVEIESEEMVTTKTLQFMNLEDVYSQLKEDILWFAELKIRQ